MARGSTTKIMTTEKLLNMLGVDTKTNLITTAEIKLGERFDEPVEIHLVIIPTEEESNNNKEEHY